ncbi:hypothetical protein MAPG_01169, partial [Magnaporthiopsis poae ATCC 64411]
WGWAFVGPRAPKGTSTTFVPPWLGSKIVTSHSSTSVKLESFLKTIPSRHQHGSPLAGKGLLDVELLAGCICVCRGPHGVDSPLSALSFFFFSPYLVSTKVFTCIRPSSKVANVRDWMSIPEYHHTLANSGSKRESQKSRVIIRRPDRRPCLMFSRFPLSQPTTPPHAFLTRNMAYHPWGKTISDGGVSRDKEVGGALACIW